MKIIMYILDFAFFYSSSDFYISFFNFLGMAKILPKYIFVQN
jgi:hypothetical protein